MQPLKTELVETGSHFSKAPCRIRGGSHKSRPAWTWLSRFRWPIPGGKGVLLVLAPRHNAAEFDSFSAPAHTLFRAHHSGILVDATNPPALDPGRTLLLIQKRAFRPSQAEMHIYRIEVLRRAKKNLKTFNVFRRRFLPDNLNPNTNEMRSSTSQHHSPRTIPQELYQHNRRL